MAIPEANDPLWKQAISGDTDYHFELLATKMLLFRLRTHYKKSPDTLTLLSSIDEFRNFFFENTDVQKVQDDLNEMIKQEKSNE